MKLSIPPRPTLIIAIVLLATNVVTGLITAHAVRARDYSNTNLTYLLTWGMISQRFEEARERKLPHVLPKTNAEIYFGYEDTARFVVRHPTAPAPSNPDSDRQVLLGWAVAADQFHSDNVNIQVDPVVWKAFLAQGPKDLPLYWEIRDDLTRAGAGKGLIHAEDPMHGMTGDKPGLYKLTAFPRTASALNSGTRS